MVGFRRGERAASYSCITELSLAQGVAFGRWRLLQHVLLVVGLDELVEFIGVIRRHSLRRLVVEVVILVMYFTV